MPVDNLLQTINGTCASQVITLQDLLLASVPEFTGGLSTALVIAVVTWSIRKRRRRRVAAAVARGDQRG
jgi:hypothetical protein